MTVNWLVAGSPLILLGVPLILFGDRNLDHQRQNMHDGKEYVWQEQFQSEIGSLIHELEIAHALSSEIQSMKDSFEDGSVPNPEGVDSREDIPMKVVEAAPFTPTLRRITDNIGTASKQMARLEENYNALPGHLRYLGLSFIGVYLTLGGSQYWYGRPLPDSAFAFSIIIAVFGVIHMKAYLDKKDELREYSDKFEKLREL